MDPEGRALADAAVTVTRFWRGGERRLEKGDEPTVPTQKHMTGPDGRWTARNLPSDLLDRIHFTGSHSNFISVQVSMDDKPHVERELRAGTYRLQLKPGTEVRGRVINEQQHPIAQARVWAGRKYSGNRQETRTDDEGRFLFRNVIECNVDFSASADGYVPAYKTKDVCSNNVEIIFKLEKGSVIRGMVRDEYLQPIAGVRVALEGAPPEPSYDRIEFSAATDSEGKFAWKSAPNSSMPFYFGKAGYMQKRGVRLKPEEDNIVTLRLTRKVDGVVQDAETEKPVTRFSVLIGKYYGEQFYPDSYQAREFKNEQGTFTVDLQEENQLRIQVTASGYAEQVQAASLTESTSVSLTFKLKQSASLVAVVKTPEGHPVPGASVAVVENGPGGRKVQFNRGIIHSYGIRNLLITTDAAGRFEISSPPEGGSVVASDGKSFGSATVAELKGSGVLTLRPYGRVEGMLLQGAADGGGQELTLNSANGVSLDFNTTKQTTDADGRFAFENIPAGTYTLIRLIKTAAGSWTHSHNTEVVVTGGETTHVVLGGMDGTLNGQLRFETPITETDYTVIARLNTVMPQLPPRATDEERKAFYGSQEWKDASKERKYYSAVVGRDGRLILDSVAPGHYKLEVSVLNSEGQWAGIEAPIRTLIVPVGAHPAVPIHIGEVLLKVVPPPPPGSTTQ